jgi:WD40 repeat protein
MHALLIWVSMGTLQHDDRELKGVSGSVLCLALSADGKLVAAGNSMDEVIVWNSESGNEAYRFTQKDLFPQYLSFSADSKALAVGGNKKVLLLDTASGRSIRELEGFREANPVAYSKDGKRLAMLDSDCRIQVLNTSDWSRVCQMAHDASTGAVYNLSFTPDGKGVATESGGPRIILWDSETGAQVRTFEYERESTSTFAFNHDGSMLVAGAWQNGALKVWDVSTGKMERSLEGHAGGVKDVTFSPDGKTIVSSGNDDTLRFWDAESGREIRTLKVKSRRVVFSPDGNTLAHEGPSWTIKLWKIR